MFIYLFITVVMNDKHSTLIDFLFRFFKSSQSIPYKPTINKVEDREKEWKHMKDKIVKVSCQMFSRKGGTSSLERKFKPSEVKCKGGTLSYRHRVTRSVSDLGEKEDMMLPFFSMKYPNVSLIYPII